MKFFLDTCSIEDIKKWKQFNLVEGVTTNPSLLSKQKNEPTSQLSKICSITNGADILTIPPTTWEKIFKNKYSKLALDGMLNDWKLIPKKK